PLARSGQVRALAVTSAKRSALAPELPALGEILPGYEAVGWYGLAVPVGAPRAATPKPNAGANPALASGALAANMRVQGYEPVRGTPEQANDWIKAEVARWTKVIRDAGIQPQ